MFMRGVLMTIEEEVQGKVDALLRYRNGLEGSELELFDMLMGYANEVARSVDSRGASCIGLS